MINSFLKEKILDKIYISIDFEDFHHDLKRDLSIWNTGKIKKDELWKSYYKIRRIISEIHSFQNKNLTFFCTGIVAKHCPDLIKKISDDGNEIACHYNFHDELSKDSLNKIEYNLEQAKDILENASSQKILGFRAPKFSITQNNIETYKLIEKHFEYDSSFLIDRHDTSSLFLNKNKIKDLKIFPIYFEKLYKFKLKLGGSYFKILPEYFIKKFLKNCINKKIKPHLYFHPYEFDTNKNYQVSFNDLKHIGHKKALYWSIRQNQWHYIGNFKFEKKLKNILKNFKKIINLKKNL